MNFRPGGAQPRMRDGWYIKNGQKVVQEMNFPADHSQYPNQPKGMKIVLTERGLWRNGLPMKCKGGCKDSATDCCATCILEHQPDFSAQRSRVQEIIEAEGKYSILFCCILLLILMIYLL